MGTLLACAFAADSLVNVAACAADRQRLRRISKVLLMPLLFLVYLLSARRFSALVASALFCGWIGDIFMMYKDDPRALAAGMGAFGAGHVLYIFALFRLFRPAPPVWALWLCPCAFLAAALGSYRTLRASIPRALRVPSLSYSLLLCAVGACSGLVLAAGNPGGGLLFAGALCFLVSDSVLSLETFRAGDKPWIDFAVMLTYIAAQALLIGAFLQ